MDYPNKPSNKTSNSDLTTPICRCRVMYLGSSVPHLTKDGLQGVQEPLKELYPESGISGLDLSNGAGIDSWISVWSNGILIENVDDFGREIRRFFPIESLHYCAAVKFVNLPDSPGVTKFLPLDSPYLRHAKNNHSPLFACILRRTTGIKVLECHAFICKGEIAANSLVRCCFHAYADNEYVKQMDENSPYAQINNRNNEQSTKDHLDGVKYNWGDGTDVTDSDNTASIQPTQKLNSIQNHQQSTKKSNDHHKVKKLTNGKKTNGFTNGQTELNSDDTEIMTTNSSISQNSPVEEEDEEITLMNSSYKIWPTSKSLSGSVKNLNLSSKEAAKIAKNASMRSLRPRQMVIPNMLAPAHLPFIPIHAIPHPQLMPQLDKSSKGTSKLLKKMSKSKSLITLVPQPPTTPIPPHAIPIGQLPPQFNGKQPQQMMFIHPNHPGLYGPPTSQMLPPMIPIATPQPIKGNIHSIKKKSKKNKEKQQFMQQQQLNEMQFISQHQGQPILIPPMRPLTPLANYLDSNQKYLIQTIGPQNTTSVYHTAPRNRKELEKLNKKLSKNKDKLSAINADELQAIINNQNNLNNYHNKQSQQQSNSNSPFNTGIYRKKPNLNERAFSYSIRQEHRSRSNSVANLNFNQDEIDHYLQQPIEQIKQEHNGKSPRKLSQNGSAILNNSNSSQGSPSSLSKQQQLARQQQQQQYYLHQQQQSLTDALNNLQLNGQLNAQLNAQPKTASIKRSKLNNNNLLLSQYHNGQLNGNKLIKNGYDHSVPPVFNGKFVLPTQNV